MSVYDDYPTVAALQHTATVIMGPNQAGYLVQILLYGVFLHMFLAYWLSGEFSTHRRQARLALGASLLLNTVYTAVCFQQAYVAGVSQDRTYDALANGDAVWNALPPLNGIISALAESYLAVRAGAYAQGAVEEDLPMAYNTASAIWMFSTAFADLSISLACAWALRTRIRGMNDDTDTLLRKLTFVFLRTAAYTTIMSLISAIILVVYKDADLLGYRNAAFWTPGAALSGLSLFTFSASSRRAINACLGNSNSGTPDDIGSGNVYIRRPALGTTSGKRSTAGPAIALQHLTSGGAAPAPVPLQISVQHESMVHFDDDEGQVAKGGSEKIGRDFAV